MPNCPELKVLPDATQTNWSIDQSMPFTFKNLSAPLAWQVLDLLGKFWTFLTSFGLGWQVLDLFDKFWTCLTILNLLDKLWTYLTSFGLACQVLDLLDKFWTCLTSVGLVWRAAKGEQWSDLSQKPNTRNWDTTECSSIVQLYTNTISCQVVNFVNYWIDFFYSEKGQHNIFLFQYLSLTA